MVRKCDKNAFLHYEVIIKYQSEDQCVDYKVVQLCDSLIRIFVSPKDSLDPTPFPKCQ